MYILENVVYFLRMNLGILQKQVQKTILAPTIQQSIEILLLPLMDLRKTIDQEIQSNPLLEINEDNQLLKTTEQLSKNLDKLLQNGDYLYYGYYFEDDAMEEKPIKREVSLEENLLRQLQIELSDPLKLKIGEMIIGNLNEDGYLKSSLEEIAASLGIEDIALVDEVLKIIQKFEPIGIASRTLSECLLNQVESSLNGNRELITKIITEHIKLLGSKKHNEIAKILKVDVEDVKSAAKIIATLEPRPARNYRPISVNIYIKPDIYITKDQDDNYHVSANNDGIPSLRISSFYKNMLNNKNLNESELTFIKERIKSALNFINSIEQRGRTLTNIAKYILDKQKEFFENGHLSLTPMTLKDVAVALKRNESTISRAINNKYIDTPSGLFPVKFFFSQAIHENGNGSVASRSIKEEIKEIVEKEDKSSPLSDQDIQNILKQKEISIARRTISKYRKILHILPSHLRKE